MVSSTASPSGQYVTSSRPRTTTQVIRLTTRNTAPKPTNRRTVRDVGGRPGEQLPGRPAVVEGHRQPLQALVERVAQIALEPQAALVHRPAAEEEQRGLGDAEHQGQAEQGHEPGAVAGGDRPVDHRRGDQRNGELGQRREQRAARTSARSSPR